MSDLICNHCGEAMHVPPGFMLVPVVPPADTEAPKPLSFEEQQEALYAILSSYQDAD